MSIVVGDSERALLRACPHGKLSALELRRRLGDATFGDVLFSGRSG